MATFNQSLTRIRRFLRDTSGTIWSSEMLRNLWNESQIEIGQSVGLLERVESYRWPPQYTYSYTHDWEELYAEGDRLRCLKYWQANAMSCCFLWEPAHWLDDDPISDVGLAITHPLECAYADPNDVILTPLHTRFDDAKFVTFDKEPIEPITEGELAKSDPGYRVNSGSPTHYYRPDNYHNHIVLYPRPTDYTWDEGEASDSFSDTLGEGMVAWHMAEVDYRDTGMITDSIGSENLLMVYEFIPYDVESDTTTWDDTLDWPAYMVHYIECGVLERAFGADTDGYIPSLRDYWALRKEIAINALKMFKRKRMSQRVFVMGSKTSKMDNRRLRLPSGYPAVFP